MLNAGDEEARDLARSIAEQIATQQGEAGCDSQEVSMGEVPRDSSSADSREYLYLLLVCHVLQHVCVIQES